jgi:AraC-like DNA-binding protein
VSCLSPVVFTRQYRRGRTLLTRHRHAASYLALVLSGGYEETGDRGTVRVRPGDVVVHGAYEAHLNRYDADGAEVLNLPLPWWFEPHTAVMRLADPDGFLRIAERDPQEAATIALSLLEPITSAATDRSTDWPHELAAALQSESNLRLSEWALRRCLAEETVSRGFQRVYGISPSAYRAQQRARRAWRRVVDGADSLCDIAAQTGFCDQAHMTREVRAITGKAPGEWRRQVKWIQDEADTSQAFSYA